MPCCLVGLGSNLGNRSQTLDQAVLSLDKHPEIELLKKSNWFSSPAAGGPAGQNDFLNGALLCQTQLSPERLLTVFQEIENRLGRRHLERWGSRTIDLDLLLYDDLTVHQQDLQVPHPRMSFRRFVLSPAAEIAADMLHPEIGSTIRQLLDHLDESSEYIAITGPPATGKKILAERLQEKCSTHLIADPADPLQLPCQFDLPSGRRVEQEIQFINQRSAQLKQIGTEINECYSISDFWLDQSLVYSEMMTDGDIPSDVLKAHKNESRRSIQPKLLVLLHAPPHWLLNQLIKQGRIDKNSDSLALMEKQLDQISRTFLQFIRMSYCGPLLLLDAEMSEEAVEEVSAAILAM